jgi:hypothetical protein
MHSNAVCEIFSSRFVGPLLIAQVIVTIFHLKNDRKIELIVQLLENLYVKEKNQH